MCHFAFSSTHLKYFILKEVSELFALPDVSSAFISGLIILRCDYKIMKEVKGGGSPELLWGHLIISMLHLLTLLCFLCWFWLFQLLYIICIYFLKIYILGKNTMSFFSDFLPLWKRKHIKTWWTRPEYNITWLCNYFFCSHFVSLSDINNWENLLQICFFSRYPQQSIN